jgi:hypothetical protein
MMKRVWMLGACLAGLSATSAPASAEENPFGYSYTADTEEKGETEVTLWATDRRGKADGRYDAQDYRLEVERGITDRFHLAGYVNFAGHHIRGLEPGLEDIRRSFAFQGASLEFKYRLLDERKEGVGLALYAEPGWSRIHQLSGEKGTEYEVELKAIVSKSWMDGRLVWAGNLTFEPEWERERELVSPSATETEWEKELKVEATTGLAFRIAPHWYAGVEARYSSLYPDWTHGLHREAFAISAGPTLAFASEEWSAALSVLPQIHGSPSPGGSQSLGEYEKREVRLKISREF